MQNLLSRKMWHLLSLSVLTAKNRKLLKLLSFSFLTAILKKKKTECYYSVIVFFTTSGMLPNTVYLPSSVSIACKCYR